MAGPSLELVAPTSLDKRGEAALIRLKPRDELRPLAVARQIEAHPGGSCPRTKGAWIVANDGSGSPAAVSPIRCRSWRCSSCSRFLSLTAYCCLADGLAKSEQVRLITLTDGSHGALDVPGLYKAWQKLNLRLKRRGLLGEFAYALELSPKRGLLHMHCLMAETDRGGGYIDQKTLSEQAKASGFGKIVDIRSVEGVGNPLADLSAYLAPEAIKNEAVHHLAMYCTKTAAALLADKSVARVRPFRTSRAWPGGNLQSCETKLLDEWYGDKPKLADVDWEFWGEWDLTQEMRTLKAIRAPFAASAGVAA